MNRTLSLSVVLAASVLLAGCAFEHTASVLAPSSTAAAITGASPTANTVATPSLVGVWASNALPTLPSPNTCGNFRYEIASQTATSIAGTFTAVCGGGLAVEGHATGQLNGTSVPLTVTGTASMTGIPSCSFTMSGTGSIEDNGNTLRIPYSGTTCLGPISGSEVLRKPSPAAVTPPPAPAPAPTPVPTPVPAPPAPNDSIDMRQASIYNSPADLASWAVTAKITSVVFTPGAFLVDFDRRDGPGRWPDVPFGSGGNLEYTLGMCLNISGHWDCSAVVEFWYGRDLAASAPPSQIASAWFYDSRWGPLTGRQPADGETVGIFVCAGDCRNKAVGDGSLVHEQSNVQLVKWSNGGGASYQF